MAKKTQKQIDGLVDEQAALDAWSFDEKAERVLDRLTVPFKMELIELDDVDWKNTDENIARSGRKFNKESVEDYALSMLDGDIFPRCVAYIKDGKYVIIAGVHRIHAAQEIGCKIVPVYLIKEQLPHIMRLIAVKTNRAEGQRASREEAIEYAVHLVMNDGLTAADVAAQLGLKPGTVAAAVRGRTTMQLAEADGFRKKLPGAMWQDLTKFRTNTKVLVSFANVLYKHKISRDVLSRLVARVLTGKNESEQLKVISDIDGEYISLKGRGAPGEIGLPKRGAFLRAWTGLSNILTKVNTDPVELIDLQIERDSDLHKRLKGEVAILIKAIKHALS